ncbi:Uu.00g143630.m01.CDS01 [Anthostomella pinea]|uniref:Uu.00g143630.m01.CDS01 n=1 Tax=Anthostomella pinea TaxID=933095 RepID=A0AAI8VQQ2_9PEZI|nr:Uu.00g143630.m01.CDS01 [Anthostomella pinea]
MGQNSSQPHAEGFKHPDSDEVDPDSPGLYSVPPYPGATQQDSSDFTFSSQIPGAANRDLKVEFTSSSPTRRPTETMAPPPNGLNMSDLSPSHQPSESSGALKSKKGRRVRKQTNSTPRPADDKRPFIPHSSLDLDAPTDSNGVGDVTGLLTVGSAGLQSDVQDDVDMNQGASQSALGVNGASSQGDAISEKELRRQQKRERKEQKKAAKLAKQQSQAEADASTSSQVPGPSKYAAHWDAHASGPARYEAPATDSDPLVDMDMDVDEEPQDETELPAHSSKKRKRKSRDQIKAEPQPESDSDQHATSNSQPPADELPAVQQTNSNNATPTSDDVRQSSKKRKSSGSGGRNKKKHKHHHYKPADLGLESAEPEDIDGDIPADGVIADSQAHRSKGKDDVNHQRVVDDEEGFSQFAEQLYSGRKEGTTHDALQNGLEPANSMELSPSRARAQRKHRNSSKSVKAAAPESEHDTSSENGDHANRMDVDKRDKGEQGEEDEPENYRDTDADGDYDNNGPQSDGSSQESGSDTGPSTTSWRKPSNEVEDPANTSGDVSDANPGVTKFEAPSSESGDDQLAYRHASHASNNDLQSAEVAVVAPDIENLPNGVSNDEVEVPSSVPRPTSVPHRIPTQAEAGPSSHGRAKTTGRKRVAKPSFLSESKEYPSPAAAAASRRQLRGQHSAEDTNVAVAGPSRAATKSKQPKISTILKGKTEDSPASSSKRIARKKRTPKSWDTLKGPFSDFELRNIREAVERWRDDNNKTQFEVNELIQGNPREVDSKDMWDHIAATCDNRPRQKVINLCRRRFHNFVARGTWTPEQHQELKDMYNEHGMQHARIGRLINRHPEDVRDRIRNYVVCGDKQRYDAWDHEEEEKLTQHVLHSIDEIHSNPEKYIYTTLPEEIVDWQLISEKMGRTRSRLQCQAKWKKVKAKMEGGNIDGVSAPVDKMIEKAREEAVLMSHRHRYTVIKAVKASEANADSRISWAGVRAEVVDQWPRPTLILVWHRLRRSIPDWRIMSVPEVCDQLVKRYKETRTLDYLADEDLDLDAEHREVEYKLRKILRSNNAPKTPRLVKSGDDEDDDEEGDEEDDQEDDEDNDDQLEDQDKDAENQPEDQDQDMEDEPEDGPAKVQESRPRARGSSVDLGVDSDSGNGDDDEGDKSEIEDSDPDVKGKQRAKAKHSRATFERNSSADVPPASTAKSNETRQKGKGNSTPAKSTPSKKANRNSHTPGEGQRVSAKKIISRKGKAKNRRRPVLQHDDVDDLSSDTNASSVLSIPAR